MISRTKYIQQYLNKGFSLIPLENNSKIPCIRWKQYQNQKATFEDMLNFYCKFKEPNIGIVTGGISRLVVLDIDDPSKLPELFKLLPEANVTTKIVTQKGYHIYFSSDGNEIKTTNNFLDLGIELKYNGCYVVASPSVINDHTYTFEIPLSKMLSFPIIAKEKDIPVYPKKKYKHNIRYRGQGVSCISQILDKNLQVGERTNSLFILYNLLLQNKNTEEYSKKLVINKNISLLRPLTELELKKVYRKAYKYGCSSIEEKLPFINCDNCKFKFKGGKLKAGNILVRNLSKIKHISNTERGIVCLLGTVFDGEVVTINEIATYANMDYRIVKKAVEGLQEGGFKVNLKN